MGGKERGRRVKGHPPGNKNGVDSQLCVGVNELKRILQTALSCAPNGLNDLFI